MVGWWQTADMLGYTHHILANMNSARTASGYGNSIVCRILFDALNQAWTAFNDYQGQRGESDSQSIRRLLSEGMPDNYVREFLQSKELEDLVEFEPHIMNHDVLRRRGYRPSQEVDPRLRRKASEEHRRLANAYKQHTYPFSDDAIASLVKKTAALLYVVRSNIAHGEKVALGNPASEEVKRDDEVSRKMIPVQSKLLDLIFDKPSQKLVVYGMLAPGAPGEYVLKNMEGTWQRCKIVGKITVREDLKYFRSYPGTNEIDCYLFSSDHLPERWSSLDAFEGNNYNRVLIPTKIADRWVVANVYEDRATENDL